MATTTQYIHETSEGGSIVRARWRFLRPELYTPTSQLSARSNAPEAVDAGENGSFQVEGVSFGITADDYNPNSGVQIIEEGGLGAGAAAGCGIFDRLCRTVKPMSVLIAMDRWKGSLTAKEANNIVESALLQCGVERIYKLPVSNGGFGFLDSIRSAHHLSHDYLTVTLPKHSGGGNLTPPSPHDGSHHIIPMVIEKSSRTAYIEAGLALSGITPGAANNVTGSMVGSTQVNCLTASSYPIGQVILKALDLGCKSICVGTGGPNIALDGGLGLLQAFGVKFLDQNGGVLPTDRNVLKEVHSIDANSIHELESGTLPMSRGRVKLVDLSMTAAVDTQQPLTGPEGACTLNANLTDSDKQEMEAAMQRYSSMVSEAFGQLGSSRTPGAGSGGGLTFGMLMLNPSTSVQNGFKIISEAADLEKRIKKADLVITGEGKFDHTSFHNKLPVEVARLARGSKSKVFVYCGVSEAGLQEAPDDGIACVIALTDETASPEEMAKAQGNVKELLHRAVVTNVQLLRVGRTVKL